MEFKCDFVAFSGLVKGLEAKRLIFHTGQFRIAISVVIEGFTISIHSKNSNSCIKIFRYQSAVERCGFVESAVVNRSKVAAYLKAICCGIFCDDIDGSGNGI